MSKTVKSRISRRAPTADAGFRNPRTGLLVMNPTTDLWRALGHRLAFAAFVLATAMPATIATAQAPAATQDPNDVFRADVGKPLQAAEELIKAGKYSDAMAKIKEAEQVPNPTGIETYNINRMRGVAALGLGDTQTAARSFDAVITSGRSSPADQLKLIETVSVMYFKARDYANAASWTQRYLKTGGTNPDMRMQLVRSLYLGEQYGAAATELRAMIDADEKAGTQPPLERLELLANAYIKTNDAAGYAFALEKLLAYYPKKEYWADAIRRVQGKPGFPDYLQLDVLRLQDATAGLTDPTQYMAMAQLALRIGVPAEAKRILDRGFAAGALGSGPDAAEQKKLLDAATKQAADDEKIFAQNAKTAAAAKDGSGLLSVGYAMVCAGHFDNGLALMEQGIQKGGFSRPDEAKLHLGIAYLAAGQKPKAITTFKSVQGGDATADLARLWLIHAQRPTG
jgi:outer membrane protein assembly factor BamD (BamD/ComL family)